LAAPPKVEKTQRASLARMELSLNDMKEGLGLLDKNVQAMTSSVSSLAQAILSIASVKAPAAAAPGPGLLELPK
jgi:hypothetical protein